MCIVVKINLLQHLDGPNFRAIAKDIFETFYNCVHLQPRS